MKIEFSPKEKKIAQSLFIATAFLFAFSFVHASWVDNGDIPPGTNALAPIHTGASQVKTGGLSLGSLWVNGDSNLLGNLGVGGHLTVTNSNGTLFSIGEVSGHPDATDVHELCFNSANCLTAWPAGTQSLWTASGNNISNSNSGNVGIGNTTFARKLSIGSVSDAYNGMDLVANNSDWIIDHRGSLDSPTNRLAYFFRSGGGGYSEMMNLQSNGNMVVAGNLSANSMTSSGNVTTGGQFCLPHSSCFSADSAGTAYTPNLSVPTLSVGTQTVLKGPVTIENDSGATVLYTGQANNYSNVNVSALCFGNGSGDCRSTWSGLSGGSGGPVSVDNSTIGGNGTPSAPLYANVWVDHTTIEGNGTSGAPLHVVGSTGSTGTGPTSVQEFTTVGTQTGWDYCSISWMSTPNGGTINDVGGACHANYNGSKSWTLAKAGNANACAMMCMKW